MRYIIALALALSSVACGENGTVDSVLPSPTTLLQAANTVCDTQITSLDFDIDYSGPHLLIEVAFASTPSPVEIEIEEYLPDGSTTPVALLTNVVGKTSVALHFNTKYRGRARAGSCPWSPWFDRQIGPPNPCGNCVVPPTPPPPQQPEDDDECEPEQPQFQGLKRMVGPPPPQECKEQ